jgi:hypothetical protein
MALDDKKTGSIHDKTGADKDVLKGKYDDGYLGVFTDLQESNPEYAALIYQIQNLSEDIDELRRFVGIEEKARIDSNTTNISSTVEDVKKLSSNVDNNTRAVATIPPITIEILKDPRTGEPLQTLILGTEIGFLNNSLRIAVIDKQSGKEVVYTGEVRLEAKLKR